MKITMRHGNGGAETAELIETLFMKHFANRINAKMEDAAVLDLDGKLAFTTDSFVVKPLFFPGGDIGRLAVCGTVNDILTTGGQPRYLSASFIIEEGLDVRDLDKIARSMGEAAREAGVEIVAGDTKVVEGDGGLYINTSGLGVIKGKPVCFDEVAEGDAIIVTGHLGDHHACILSQRMGIENAIASDVAPLNAIVGALAGGNISLHGMRDITRGGLATVLNEISAACSFQIAVDEAEIPVAEEVNSLCKILGLDPLYMGNEGKLLVVVPEREAHKALAIIKHAAYGGNAGVVGRFQKGAGVVLNTRLGGRRILQPMMGDGLPRIC